jgi:hypothetical protein
MVRVVGMRCHPVTTRIKHVASDKAEIAVPVDAARLWLVFFRTGL